MLGKKRLFVKGLSIFLLTLLFSCTQKSNSMEKDILIETDLAFSKLSEEKGVQFAFLEFIGENGVMLRDNSYPIKGKEKLAEIYAESSDTAYVLIWEPLFADIAKSLDLGYTYGVYTLKIKETGEISRGNYVSIWKKQEDCTWKFVLDSGTEGLPVIGE